MQTNLLGNRKTDINYMAQDFDVFGVEINKFTIEQLDQKMEAKIEKLQNWLRNAKYTDHFINEFQTEPQADQESLLFSRPKIISNFKTLLYEYRTLRNWFIYKNKPILNPVNDKTDEIKMRECNYSVNPIQYETEYRLQEWFTELSNPMRPFVMKKFKEYAENDLYYIKIGTPFRGRPWFMDFETYEEMEKFLVEYSSPCTVEDLQKKLDLLIQNNIVKIQDTGNEILNSFLFDIERLKRMSDINSLKMFIYLIEQKRIKPSKKDISYKNSMCTITIDQQTDFEIKKKSAIDYLESIKPSNTKISDYYKNTLFDKYNDVYNNGGLREAITESFISKYTYNDSKIRNERIDKLSQICNEIENYYIDFNHFLEQIDILNKLIANNGKGNLDSEIYRYTNTIMNSFIDIEDIGLVDKIRKEIQKDGLTISLVKWSDKEPTVYQIMKLKDIDELRCEKCKVIDYIINLDNDDIDFSIVLPLIEKVYSKYEMVRGSYDYINDIGKSEEIYNRILRKGLWSKK